MPPYKREISPSLVPHAFLLPSYPLDRSLTKVKECTCAGERRKVWEEKREDQDARKLADWCSVGGVKRLRWIRREVTATDVEWVWCLISRHDTEELKWWCHAYSAGTGWVVMLKAGWRTSPRTETGVFGGGPRRTPTVLPLLLLLPNIVCGWCC